MNFSAVITFFGGIGLFLLGMRLMTEGLKVAAGHGLRDLLARGTTTRLRAVGSGLAITSLVQSSSAVTFATIGFVNAGLLTLPQSIGVIYGANLGTTITSWLVALVGFKFDLKALALPAIAIGMAMRVVFRDRREGALGEALAGFGVFFIGIDILKDAFSGFGAFVGVDEVQTGARGLLPYLGVGFLLTLVMQSSSAALVVTLSAAASGVVPLTAAAVMVIGANVGTTTTAVFAVIGATAAAKRAAAAHVLFNVVVAVFALIALPLLLWIVASAGQLILGHPLAIATALAAFHTLTKLSGIVLLWPFTDRLTDWLGSRFQGPEEATERPRFLDRAIAQTPALAVNALGMELERAAELARRAATGAVNIPTGGQHVIVDACKRLDGLLEVIGEFAAAIRNREQADMLANVLRIKQYLADVSERSVEYLRQESQVSGELDAELAVSARELRTRALAVLAGAGTATTAHQDFELHYQATKSMFLRAGAEGRLDVRRMVALLDQFSALRRLLDQWVKAERGLIELQSSLARSEDTA